METSIILNWWYDETIADAQIVRDENGQVIPFQSKDTAMEWAKENLNGLWCIVTEQHERRPSQNEN